MKAWYLVYNEVAAGKYTDENNLVEVRLLALTEDAALLEAKKKLSKLIAQFDENFEARKKNQPAGHFAKKQVTNPHVILKIPL